MSSFSMLLTWVATGVAVGWCASMTLRTSGSEGAFFDALVGGLGATSGGFATQHFLSQWLGEHALAVSVIAAGLGAGVLIGLWRLLLMPPAAR